MKRSFLSLLPPVVVAIGLVVGAAGVSAEAAPSKVAETCPEVKASRPRTAHLKAPPQTVTRRDRLEAVVRTNCGPFTIQLDARRFPVAVNSFVYLARKGFYDGLQFERVIPDFVIEGGDPRGNQRSGPGYTVTDPPPPHFHYRLGTVGMGRAADEPPGSAGSDFFVVVGRGAQIKPEYAVVGQVRAGIETIKRIGALGDEETERPSQIVKIESIRIRPQRSA